MSRGRKWSRLAWAIKQRDGWRCQRCGGAGRLEVDHKVRLTDGGAEFDPANLQTLCRQCHIDKTRAENRRDDPARAAWRRYLDTLG